MPSLICIQSSDWIGLEAPFLVVTWWSLQLVTTMIAEFIMLCSLYFTFSFMNYMPLQQGLSYFWKLLEEQHISEFYNFFFFIVSYKPTTS